MLRGHRFPIHLAGTILVMVFIFVQSAMPADLSSQESGILVGLVQRFYHGDVENVTFAVRKLAHFTEYLLLGWFVRRTAEDVQRKRRHGAVSGAALSAGLAWLLGTLYAATDELHQILTPGRSCEWRDVLIDSSGVALGVLLAWLAGRRRGTRVEDHEETEF